MEEPPKQEAKEKEWDTNYLAKLLFLSFKFSQGEASTQKNIFRLEYWRSTPSRMVFNGDGY